MIFIVSVYFKQNDSNVPMRLPWCTKSHIKDAIADETNISNADRRFRLATEHVAYIYIFTADNNL